MKKLTIHNEIAYVLAIVFLSFAVAMLAAADFGVSMITGIPYILYLYFKDMLPFLTLGMWEYFIQTLLLIAFCIITRHFKIVYLSSYICCILYTLVLDLVRKLIPVLNPDVTAPGSMAMPFRIVLFVSGMVLTSFAISIFFHTYMYPQVYDFFIKGLCIHFGWNLIRGKRIYDASLLLGCVVLSLILFHGFKGIGIGTIIITIMNSILIGLFGKFWDRCTKWVSLFPKLEKKFEIE